MRPTQPPHPALFPPLPLPHAAPFPSIPTKGRGFCLLISSATGAAFVVCLFVEQFRHPKPLSRATRRHVCGSERLLACAFEWPYLRYLTHLGLNSVASSAVFLRTSPIGLPTPHLIGTLGRQWPGTTWPIEALHKETIYEHRRAAAAVSPPSHTHRYARDASFSKRLTLAVYPELDLISAAPLAKHRARKSSGPWECGTVRA